MSKEIVNKRRKLTPYACEKSTCYVNGQGWAPTPLHIHLMGKLYECTRVAIATNPWIQ
jgi:hypothetical protein